MEEEITNLWNQYQSENIPPSQIERRIFSEAKSRGWNLAKVMLILRELRYPSQRKRTTVPATTISAMAGCQQDDEGRVLDPFSLQEIQEEFLISYVENDKRFCFDIRELSRAISEGIKQNPLTMINFPEEVLNEVKKFLVTLEHVLFVGPDKTPIKVYTFSSVISVLLEVYRNIDNNILTIVGKICPFYNGKSLYSFMFEEPFPFEDNVNVIDLYPFSDNLEQAISLKKLFEYCSRNRQEGGILASLFLELGFLLRVPPRFLDESGQTYILNPEDTVYDTIRKIYIWLGGLHQVQRYNLVLENGTRIHIFNMEKLVSQLIPSLEIRYIYYEDEADSWRMKSDLFRVAFQKDDEEFIRALATNPEERLSNTSSVNAVIADLNFTRSDLQDYVLGKIDKNEDIDDSILSFMKRISHSDAATKIIRHLILSCMDRAERMFKCVEFITKKINPPSIGYTVSWREVDVLSKDVAVDPKSVLYEFLWGVNVRKRKERDIFFGDLDILFQGDSLPVEDPYYDDFYTNFLVKLDDVEFFYRHYEYIKHSELSKPEYVDEFLSHFLNFNSGKIRAYILENEPAITLYRVLTKNDNRFLVKLVLDRLSEFDIIQILNNAIETGENPLFFKLIVTNPNFPIQILNDEKYYYNINLLDVFVRNPRFNKFNKALKFLLGKYLTLARYHPLLTKIIDKLSPKELFEILDETQSTDLYELLVAKFQVRGSEIPQELTLRVTPQVLAKLLDSATYLIETFLSTTQVTKQDVISTLCTIGDQSLLIPGLKLLLNKVPLENHEIQDLLSTCQIAPFLAVAIALTSNVPFSAFKDYLRDENIFENFARMFSVVLREFAYYKYSNGQYVFNETDKQRLRRFALHMKQYRSG